MIHLFKAWKFFLADVNFSAVTEIELLLYVLTSRMRINVSHPTEQFKHERD